LCPDGSVSVDFQQQRVTQAAVDHVRLADAAAQAVEARFDLRIMPASMTPRAISS